MEEKNIFCEWKERENEAEERRRKVELWFRSRTHRSGHLTSAEARAPSANGLRDSVDIVLEYATKGSSENNKLILRLAETDTMWLLSIDSIYSGDDEEDKKRVAKDNETYEKLTTGKALERKRSAAETQTPQSIEKCKGTVTADIVMVESFVNASAWDLYDTYAELVGDKSEAQKDFQKLIDTVLKAKGALTPGILQSKQSHEVQIKKLFTNDEFKYALLIAERLLASNYYQTKQCTFKKCIKSKYADVEPTTYKYEAHELWTYEKDLGGSLPLSVTSMDWNPYNTELLAVGYGNLELTKGFGKVCVWSPKNPVHPEREYTLEHCVSALSFSVTRPNLIAVGCRNGDVCIVDVSTDDGRMRMLGRNRIHCRHGPVWKIQWLVNEKLFEKSEEVLSIGEGGILIRYTFPDDSETVGLLQLEYVSAITTSYLRNTGKTVTSEYREISKMTKTYMKHTFSGLCFSVSSDQSMCYISTKEGIVIKVTLTNNCKMDDLFSAHLGPVYEIQHSPFTDLIYLTCGADWCVRIWIEGILEPLFTLSMQNPVMSATWSPYIATLIGTISGTDFALWDIAKNVFLPANVIHLSGSNFSKVLFTPKGTNVVLGDESGTVRILNLRQLPRQPFMQKEALVNAIEKGLFNKTDLLMKFKRVVALNKDLLRTEIA